MRKAAVVKWNNVRSAPKKSVSVPKPTVRRLLHRRRRRLQPTLKWSFRPQLAQMKPLRKKAIKKAQRPRRVALHL